MTYLNSLVIVENIRLLAVLASEEGLKNVLRAYPGLDVSSRIHSAALLWLITFLRSGQLLSIPH